MGRDTENTDAAGGVFDHGQHIQAGDGQRHGLEEVRGDETLGSGAQEPRPSAVCALGCRVDAGVFRISQPVEPATFAPRTSSSP